MSIQIGKLMPNGAVKHIKAFIGSLTPEIASRLQLFYKNEKRVDALLALGDIMVLGPSPYGKWSPYEDRVHCCALIRDRRGEQYKNMARIADNVDTFAHMGNVCLLFADGEWFVIANGRRIDLSSYHDWELEDSMAGLKVYVNKKDGSGGLSAITTPESWSELQKYSDDNKRILYVLRGNHLVRIFKPFNLIPECHV